jgi:hypothetical protein
MKKPLRLNAARLIFPVLLRAEPIVLNSETVLIADDPSNFHSR